VAPSLPKAIFSEIVPEKRIGSWLTSPICLVSKELGMVYVLSQRFQVQFFDVLAIKQNFSLGRVVKPLN
jgi:hypothetical protein